MGKISIKLSVFYKDSFWVGIFECVENDMLTVAKTTFVSEPKEYDVLAFILNKYSTLRFSPAVATVVKKEAKNPKRRQREVKKQVQNTRLGTKSQQALKLQQEQVKTIKKEEQKETKKIYRFYKNSKRRKRNIEVDNSLMFPFFLNS